MTLDEYNLAVKAILGEQQEVAQEAVKLWMSDSAHVMNPEFVKLLSRQGALVERLAQFNVEGMLGIGRSCNPWARHGALATPSWSPTRAADNEHL